MIAPMDRKKVALLTWHCDWISGSLVVLYMACLAPDIWLSSALITDPTWYARGFCVWESAKGAYWDSFTVCFWTDLLICVPLACYNFAKLKSGEFLPLMVCLSQVLHGLAHLHGHYEDPNDTVLAIAHRTDVGPVGYLVAFTFGFLFLGLGPWVGNFFGAGLSTCLAVHTIFCVLSMWIPGRFGFAVVQVYLMGWYCIVRFKHVGCNSQEDIAKRVDGGWAVGAVVGVLSAIVPLWEILGCRHSFMALGGHALYDNTLNFLCVLATADLHWNIFGLSMTDKTL